MQPQEVIRRVARATVDEYSRDGGLFQPGCMLYGLGVAGAGVLESALGCLDPCVI